MRRTLIAGWIALMLAVVASAQGVDPDQPRLAEITRLSSALADADYGADALRQTIAQLDRIAGDSAGPRISQEAFYAAADAARAGGLNDEAVRRLEELSARYPMAPISARALVRSAAPLMRLGRTTRALENLQRVRDRFADSPEARTAVGLLTILHRFYLRPSSQVPFQYVRSVGGPGGKLKDARDVMVKVGDGLVVATKTNLLEFDGAGEVTQSTDVQEPRAVFPDSQGRPMTVHEQGTIRGGGSQPLVLSAARGNGRVEPLDIDNAVTTSTGDVIVTNRAQKTLVRFSRDGLPKGDFAKAIAARRLAVSDVDDVAALETDQKAITLFNRSGRVGVRLAERGTGYQFRQPGDVAFDGLGHLYVLDRGTVLVFAPRGDRVLATFPSPERVAGTFTNSDALAVDGAGRLYILDARAGLVQVYR